MLPDILYVLGTDGDVALRKVLAYEEDGRYTDACLIPGGLVIAEGNAVRTGGNGIERVTRLTEYDVQDDILWSREIPDPGHPRLERFEGANGVTVSLTITAENNYRCVYLLSSASGHPECCMALDAGTGIRPVGDGDSFYLHPSWSLYPDIPAPAGSVILWRNGDEEATAEFSEGIYHFAASPDGRYFAILTKNTLSVFSLTEQD